MIPSKTNTNVGAIPTVETLQGMPLRDLAGFVVFRFALLKKNEYTSTFIHDLLTAYYSQSTAVRNEAATLLSEGLEYALHDGLLGHDFTSSAGPVLNPLRITRRGERLLKYNGYATPWRDLAMRELLHTLIEEDALIELERGVQHYPVAIFKAFKAVEIAVRDASDYLTVTLA